MTKREKSRRAKRERKLDDSDDPKNAQPDDDGRFRDAKAYFASMERNWREQCQKRSDLT